MLNTNMKGFFHLFLALVALNMLQGHCTDSEYDVPIKFYGGKYGCTISFIEAYLIHEVNRYDLIY